MSKSEMYDTIKWAIGGRAAEQVFLKEISTGAVNDIERSTNMANKMVKQYGMSKLGPMAFGSSNEEIFLGKEFGHSKNYSEELASEIDKEVMKLLKDAYEEAKRLLREHRNSLDKISDFLIEKETITGKEFMEIFRQVEGISEEETKEPQERIAMK